MAIPKNHTPATLPFVLMLPGAVLNGCGTGKTAAADVVAEDQQALRFDTFGDDQVWDR